MAADATEYQHQLCLAGFGSSQPNTTDLSYILNKKWDSANLEVIGD